MQLVHVYLNFPGTTEAAFRFYEGVFRTRVVMPRPTARSPR